MLLVQGFWSKNSWGFPKGKVNEGEDPARCAVREVLEETGYDISSIISNREFLETTVIEIEIINKIFLFYLYILNARSMTS